MGFIDVFAIQQTRSRQNGEMMGNAQKVKKKPDARKHRAVGRSQQSRPPTVFDLNQFVGAASLSEAPKCWNAKDESAQWS